MRVAVVGATGNVGTSLLRALADDGDVDSILGLARRLPETAFPKTDFAAADIARDELVPHLRGADAVVHLAWVIQPSHDRDTLWRINVDGSRRVFRAVAEAGVPVLVYASSVGAYSPGPKDRYVDESWPTDGIETSSYARHKAEVERWLDRFEREHPQVRVVRLRPGLIFKRESAAEQRRLFAGPLFPTMVARKPIPFVPDIPGLRFQAVHSYDVGEAYRLAVKNDVHGAFNVAAEPVLDPPTLARLLGARTVAVPKQVVRAAVQLTWWLHLQPSDVGWVDMGLSAPLLDTTRARTELGWQAQRGADDAMLDLLEGLREDAGMATPPLRRRSRAQELGGGVGRGE
jgi:nucleoside-diphosphate-sugar epimerase